MNPNQPKGDSRLADLIEVAERVVYFGAAAFLLVTIGVIFVSAGAELLTVFEVGPLQAALDVLDQVLLVFILAELLRTVSTIVRQSEILAEPFLLIGIIAVVRRILAVTVSIEQSLGTQDFYALLIELGVLTVLVISLSTALYIARRVESLLPHGAAREDRTDVREPNAGNDRV